MIIVMLYSCVGVPLMSASHVAILFSYEECMPARWGGPATSPIIHNGDLAYILRALILSTAGENCRETGAGTKSAFRLLSALTELKLHVSRRSVPVANAY